jgi:hypothetical protein
MSRSPGTATPRLPKFSYILSKNEKLTNFENDGIIKAWHIGGPEE